MSGDATQQWVEADTGPDGSCWECEDREPVEVGVISIGPLSMAIALCDDCAEQLEGELGS